jgi:hypothetical protein
MRDAAKDGDHRPGRGFLRRDPRLLGKHRGGGAVALRHWHRIGVVLRLFGSRAILLGRISLISAVSEGSRHVAHSLR